MVLILEVVTSETHFLAIQSIMSVCVTLLHTQRYMLQMANAAFYVQ